MVCIPCKVLVRWHQHTNGILAPTLLRQQEGLVDAKTCRSGTVRHRCTSANCIANFFWRTLHLFRMPTLSFRTFLHRPCLATLAVCILRDTTSSNAFQWAGSDIFCVSNVLQR